MSFKDITGQDAPIARLKAAIKSGRIASTYLFTGPEGIGKKLAAKTFAKALNCLNQDLDACDSCSSCRAIEGNTHPDVRMIDKSELHEVSNEITGERASLQTGQLQAKAKPSTSEEIKIDDIRLLQQEIALRPYEARCKVFIINDAHMLNAESSNAFLKTLEEPPKSSIIILVTSRALLLYKTILSRCQTIKFSALPRPEFEAALRSRLTADEHSLHYLAYFCEGRLGSALRAHETQAIAWKNRVIDYFVLAPHPSVEDSFIQDREYLRGALQILAAWFRDIYLYKAGIGFEGLINLDRKDAVQEVARKYSFTQIDQILRTISDSLGYIHQNANVKLLLATILFSIRDSL